MRDFSLFPGSRPDDLKDSDKLYADTKLEFTSTENVDEQVIYKEVNKRLGELETSLEVNQSALTAISRDAQRFRVRYEEKEEIELRISWLERLYEAKDNLVGLKSKEEAEDLLRFISSVQTCPVKGELEKQLKEKIEALPARNSTISPEETMMEHAITEAGDDFINLGAAGRNAVLDTVINQGSELDLELVRELTRQLESKVRQLKTAASSYELAEKLNGLPLLSWNELDLERQGMISEHLFAAQEWSGLSALDRSIYQLNNRIAAEQDKLEAEKHVIQAGDKQATAVLNAELLRKA